MFIKLKCKNYWKENPEKKSLDFIEPNNGIKNNYILHST